MSWAQEEWKDGLNQRVLMKITQIEDQNVKLKKETKQKQFQLDSLEAACATQKRKVEEEKGKITNLKRENQNLSETCSKLEHKTDKLGNDLKCKENHLSSVEDQLRRYKSQVEQLSSKSSKNHSMIIENDQQNDQMKSKLTEVQSLLEREKTKTKSLENELSEHRKSSSRSTSFVSALPWATDDILFSTPMKPIKHSAPFDLLTGSPLFKNTAASSNTTMPALVTPAGDCNKDFEQLKIEIDSLKQKCVDQESNFAKEAKQMRLKLDENAKEITKKSNEIGRFQMQVGEYTTKINELEKKLSTVGDELKCERHNSEASRTLLQNKAKEVEKSHKQEMATAQDSVRALEKIMNENKTKFAQELSQEKNNNHQLESELNKLGASKSKVECDLKKTQQKLLQVEQMLQASDNKAKQLETQRKELNKEKDNLASNLQRSENKLVASEQQNEVAKRALQASEDKLSDARREVGRMERERNDLKERTEKQIKSQGISIENLTQKVGDLERKKCETETLVKNKEKEFNQLSFRHTELEASMTESSQNLIKYKKEAASLSAENSMLVGQGEATVAQLKKVKAQLEEREGKYEQDLECARCKLDDTVKEWESKVEATKSASQKELENLEISSNRELQSLNDQIKDHEKIVDELRAQCESSRQEVDGVKSQLDDSNRNLEELRSQNRDKTEEISRLKATRDELSDKFEFGKAELSRVTRELRELAESKLGLEEEHKKLLHRAQNDAIECRSLEGRVQDLEAQVEGMRNDEGHIGNVRLQLDESEKAHGRLHKQVSDLEAEVQIKVEQEVTLNSQLSGLKDSLEKAVSENETLKLDLNKSVESLSKCKVDFESKLAAKSDNIEALTGEIASINSEKDQVLEKLMNSESILSNLRSENGDFSRNLELFQQREQASKEAITQLQKQLNLKEQSINEMVISLNENNSEIERLNCTLDGLHKDNGTLSDELVDKKMKIDQLQEALDSSKERCANLTVKNEEVEGNLVKLEQKLILEVTKHETIFAQKDDEILNLISKNEGTRKQLEATMVDLNTMKEQKEQFDLEKNELQYKISNLESCVLEESQQKDSTEKNLADLNVKYDLDLSGFKCDIESLKLALQDLENEKLISNDVLSQKESVIVDLNKEIQSLLEEKNSLDQDSIDFNSQIQAKDKEIMDLKNVRDDLKQKIDDKEKEIISVQAEQEKVEASSLAHKKGLGSENEDLRMQMKEISSEVENLKESNSFLSGKREQFSKELEELKMIIEKRDGSLELAQMDLEDKEDFIKDLEEKISHLEQKTKMQEEELLSKFNELEDAKKNLELINGDLEKSKLEIQALVTKLAAQEALVSNLNETYQKHEEELNEVVKEKEMLISDAEKFKDLLEEASTKVENLSKELEDTVSRVRDQDAVILSLKEEVAMVTKEREDLLRKVEEVESANSKLERKMEEDFAVIAETKTLNETLRDSMEVARRKHLCEVADLKEQLEKSGCEEDVEDLVFRYESKVGNMEEMCDRFAEDNRMLREEAASLGSEVARMSQNAMDLEMEIDEAEEKIKRSRAELEEVLAQSRKKDEDLEEILKQSRKKDKNIEEVLAQSRKKDEDLEEVGMKNKELESDLEQQRYLVDDYLRKIAAKEAEVFELESHLDSTHSENRTLSEVVTQLESRVAELTTSIHDLEEVKHKVMEDLEEQLNIHDHLVAANISLNKTLVDISEKSNENEKKIAEDFSKKLESKKLEHSEFESAVKELNSKNEALEEINTDLTQQLDSVNIKLTDSTGVLKRLRLENDQYQMQMQASDNEFKESKDRFMCIENALRAENSGLKSKLIESKEKLNEGVEKTTEQEKILNELHDKISILNVDISARIEANRNLSSNLDSVKKLHESNVQIKTELAEQNELLNVKISELEDAATEHGLEMKQLVEKYRASMNEIHKLGAEKLSLESELKESKQLRDSLEEELNKSLTKLASIESEKLELENVFTDHLTKLLQLGSTYMLDDALSPMESDASHKSRDVHMYVEKILKHQQNEIHKINSDLQSKTGDCEGFEKSLGDEKLLCASVTQKLDSTLAKLTETNAELECCRSQFNDAKEECENLKSQLESKTEMLKENQVTLFNLKEEIATITDLNNHLNDNLKERDSELSVAKCELNAKIEQISLENCGLLEKIDSFGGSLEEKDSKIEEIEFRLANKEDDIICLNSEIEELEKMVENQEKLIEESKFNLNQGSEEIAALKTTVTENEDTISSLECKNKNATEELKTMKNMLENTQFQHQSKITELSGQISKMDQSISDLKSENTSIQVDCKLEIEKLNSELLQKDQYLNELKLKLQKLENCKLENNGLLTQITNLETDLSEELDRKIQLQQELEIEMKSSQELQSQLTDNEIRITVCNSLISQLQAAQHQYIDSATLADKQLDEIRNEFECQLNESKQELEKVKKAISDADTENINKDNTILSLQTDNHNINVELIKMKESVEKDLLLKDESSNLFHQLGNELSELQEKFENLESEKIDLEKMVNEKNGELNQLKVEVEHMVNKHDSDIESSLEAKELIINELSGKLDVLNEEIATYEEKLKLKMEDVVQSCAQISELNEKNELLYEECDSLRSKITEKCDEIAVLNNELTESQCQLTLKVQDFENKEKENIVLLKEIEDLRENVNSRDILLKEKEVIWSENCAEISNLKLQLDDCEKEKIGFIEKFENLEQEISSKENTIKEIQIKLSQSEAEILNLTNRLSDCEQKVCELDLKYTDLNQEKSVLDELVSEKTQSLENLKAEILEHSEKHCSKVESLQRNLEEEWVVCEGLRNELNVLNEEKDGQSDVIDILRHKLSEKSNDFDVLQSKFEENKEKTRDRQLELSALEEEKDSLLRENEDSRQKLFEVGNENKLLKSRLGVLETLVAETETTNADMSKQLKQLNTTLTKDSKLNSEKIENLLSENSAINNKYLELEEEKKSLKAELSAAKAELENSKQRLKVLESLGEELEKEQIKYEVSKSSLENELSALTTKMKEQSSSLQRAEEDASYLEERVKEEEVRAEEAEQLLEESTLVCESLRLSLENERAKVTEQQQQFAVVEGQSQSCIGELNSKVAQLLSRLDSSEETCLAKVEEVKLALGKQHAEKIKDLQRQCQKMMAEFETVTKNISELEEEKSSLQARVSALKAELKSGERRHLADKDVASRFAAIKLQRALADWEELEEESRKNTEARIEAETLARDLRSENEELKKNCLELQKNNETLKKNIDVIKGRLNLMTTTAKRKEKELHQLQERNDHVPHPQTSSLGSQSDHSKTSSTRRRSARIKGKTSDIAQLSNKENKSREGTPKKSKLSDASPASSPVYHLEGLPHLVNKGFTNIPHGYSTPNVVRRQQLNPTKQLVAQAMLKKSTTKHASPNSRKSLERAKSLRSHSKASSSLKESNKNSSNTSNHGSNATEKWKVLSTPVHGNNNNESADPNCKQQ